MHICPNNYSGRSTMFWSIVTQRPRTLVLYLKNPFRNLSTIVGNVTHHFVRHGCNMVFILEVEAKA